MLMKIVIDTERTLSFTIVPTQWISPPDRVKGKTIKIFATKQSYWIALMRPSR